MALSAMETVMASDVISGNSWRVLIGLGLLWGIACSDETRPVMRAQGGDISGQTKAADPEGPAALVVRSGSQAA